MITKQIFKISLATIFLLFSVAFRAKSNASISNTSIFLDDCRQVDYAFYCQDKPVLNLMASNNSEDDFALKIIGEYKDNSFECLGNICKIELAETDSDGEVLTFQTHYSEESSIAHKWAIIRVTRPTSEMQDWRVDIISSQLLNYQFSCCALEWVVFPPEENIPLVYNQEESIQTHNTYYYLANNLIQAEVVDASDCPNGGIQDEDYANYCGYQLAEGKVHTWQNQFDNQILESANQVGIPPDLLKAIIAQESQFWPADHDEIEFGFGHITENAIDSILLWSPEFFGLYYRNTFGEPLENNFIAHGIVSEYEKTEIRKTVLNDLKLSCLFCEYGIDMEKAPKNIEILAYAISASAHQTGQVIRNTTGMRPGEIITYQDLWRLTLVNYHAGPQCLGDAVFDAYTDDENLTYMNVEEKLSAGCATAKKYVNAILPIEDIAGSPFQN